MVFEINHTNKNYFENKENAKHLRSLYKLEPAMSAESRNAQTLISYSNINMLS